MAIYDLKEFLTFDDVADYLRDKGVYDFVLSNNSDRNRLNDFLKDMILSNKLSIVFRYYGKLDIFNREFVQDKRPVKDKINIFTNEQSLVLLFDDYMLKGWLNGNDFLRHGFFDERIHTDYWKIPTYKLFGYEYTITENKEHPFIILLDDSNGQYGLEPLFPKCQLDKLFLKKQKETLQNQINSIDSQLDNKELTANSQTAVAKLLYALLKEHNYELGTTKGATNDTLFNLCESHNVKLSRETIAKWLDKVNDLEK